MNLLGKSVTFVWLVAVTVCDWSPQPRVMQDEPITVTLASIASPPTIRGCSSQNPRAVRVQAFKASNGTEFVRQLVNSEVFRCWEEGYEASTWQGVDNLFKCGEATVKAGLNTFLLNGTVCTAYLGRRSLGCQMSSPDTVVYTARTPLAEFVPAAPTLTSLNLTKGSDNSSIVVSWVASDLCLEKTGFRIKWDLGSIDVGSDLNTRTIDNIKDCELNNVTVTVLDGRNDAAGSNISNSVDMFHVPSNLITLGAIERHNMTTVDVAWTTRMAGTCAYRLTGYQVFYTTNGQQGPSDFIPMTESNLTVYTYSTDRSCGTAIQCVVQALGPNNQSTDASAEKVTNLGGSTLSTSGKWCVLTTVAPETRTHARQVTVCQEKGGHLVDTQQAFDDLYSKLRQVARPALGLKRVSGVWTWTGDGAAMSLNNSYWDASAAANGVGECVKWEDPAVSTKLVPHPCTASDFDVFCIMSL